MMGEAEWSQRHLTWRCAAERLPMDGQAGAYRSQRRDARDGKHEGLRGGT